MSLVIPNASAIYLLGTLIDSIDTWYHLFTNDVTVGPTTIITDFTEARWPAYKPVEVKYWSPPVTSGLVAVSQSDAVFYVRGVGGTVSQVYGYYVTDGISGALLWAETRAAGPIPMTAPSDALVLLPQITLRYDPSPPTM